MSPNSGFADYDLLVVAGFAENDKDHRITNMLKDRLKPRQATTVAMAPLTHTGKSYEESIAEVISAIRGETLLVGHCAGAVVALAAACRLRFQNILKLISIYGPINRDVAVNPVPVFSLPFMHFYHGRLELLNNCQPALDEAGTSKIVTIGNLEDWVVPPAAKRLPGDYTDIHLTDRQDLSALSSRDHSRGLHVVLPLETHMLRGDNMQFVGDVIEKVMTS